MKKNRKQRYGTGEVRIIGGQWRRQHIHFPAELEIRPTPDRLRETLFNWLGGWIEGSCVLDLFAGSGALGIEALSRGAAEAVFVERDRRAADALRANLQSLNVNHAQVNHADALSWLETQQLRPYDIVFIDPPYALGETLKILNTLSAAGCLAAGHRVYLEQSANNLSELPADCEVLRQSHAGDAVGRLLQFQLSTATRL